MEVCDEGLDELKDLVVGGRGGGDLLMRAGGLGVVGSEQAVVQREAQVVCGKGGTIGTTKEE